MINAACAIILDDKGKCFISKRSMSKKEYPGLWELPGGKFEKGEDIHKCIIREIKEEIGVDITYIDCICIQNVDKYKVHYCLCKSDFKNISTNSEIEEYKFIDINDHIKYEMIDNNHNIINLYISNQILYNKLIINMEELKFYKSVFKTHYNSAIYNLKIKKKKGKPVWIDVINIQKKDLMKLDMDDDIKKLLVPVKCER